MKTKSKISLLVLTVILAVMVTVLVSCGNNGKKPQPSKDPITNNTTNAENSIEYVKSDKYQLTTSVNKARAGERVEISIKVIDPTTFISKVLYNSKELVMYDNEKYYFTMPNEKVKLVVVLSEVTEKLKDNFARFVSPENGNVIYQNSGLAKFVVSLSDHGFSTILTKKDVQTLNEDVIPTSAITRQVIFQHGGNLIEGDEISIDTSMVKLGEAFLKFRYKSGNISDYDATLYVKVTVMPKKEIVVWDESVVIDERMLMVADQKYEITITETAENGKTTQQVFGNLEPKSNKISATFKYVEGRTYTLTLKNSENKIIKLSEAVGQGSTTTGFNQFKDGYLKFIENNQTLSINAINS